MDQPLKAPERSIEKAILFKPARYGSANHLRNVHTAGMPPTLSADCGRSRFLGPAASVYFRNFTSRARLRNASTAQKGKEEKVKMLTPDGKLVEVNKSVIEKNAGVRKATDQEVFDWMDQKHKK